MVCMASCADSKKLDVYHCTFLDMCTLPGVGQAVIGRSAARVPAGGHPAVHSGMPGVFKLVAVTTYPSSKKLRNQPMCLTVGTPSFTKPHRSASTRPWSTVLMLAMSYKWLACCALMAGLLRRVAGEGGRGWQMKRLQSLQIRGSSNVRVRVCFA